MKPMITTRLRPSLSKQSASLGLLSGTNSRIWVRCRTSVNNQRSIERNLRQKVKNYAKIGDYSQAIALLTHLLRHHPDSAIDYNNRGLMYYYDQQPQKALQDYNLALMLDPLLDSVYNNRANCYGSQGQLFEALQDYQRALDLNPWNVRALINLGITYRDLGDYSAAIEQFDTALLWKDSHQSRIYGERGYTYQLRGDWNCAIADYQRSLKGLTSGNLTAYQRKISTLLQQLLNVSPSN